MSKELRRISKALVQSASTRKYMSIYTVYFSEMWRALFVVVMTTNQMFETYSSSMTSLGATLIFETIKKKQLSVRVVLSFFTNFSNWEITPKTSEFSYDYTVSGWTIESNTQAIRSNELGFDSIYSLIKSNCCSANCTITNYSTLQSIFFFFLFCENRNLSL